MRVTTELISLARSLEFAFPIGTLCAHVNGVELTILSAALAYVSGHGVRRCVELEVAACTSGDTQRLPQDMPNGSEMLHRALACESDPVSVCWT